MKRTKRTLPQLTREAQAARAAYHASQSAAARKRLKTALKWLLLAGGTVYANAGTQRAEAGD